MLIDFTMSDAQPQIFQNREGFAELGNFDKPFVKVQERWMDTIRAFFPKSGHFFLFSKKSRGDLPPPFSPRLVVRKKLSSLIVSIFIFSQFF